MNPVNNNNQQMQRLPLNAGIAARGMPLLHLQQPPRPNLQGRRVFVQIPPPVDMRQIPGTNFMVYLR